MIPPGTVARTFLKIQSMKIFHHKVVAGFFTSLGIVALIIALTEPHHAQSKISSTVQIASESKLAAGSQLSLPHAQPAARPVAPFIAKDTDNDSPGTNIVTRIVTFTAEIGGTPPPFLQWKVDQGAGFVDVPGATNATYRIGNAQVEHNGFYSLFATNSAGSIHTAPQQLIVSEGVD